MGASQLQKVLSFARAIADEFTVDRSGKRHELAWRINCWANVNRLAMATSSTPIPARSGPPRTTSMTAALAPIPLSAASSRSNPRGVAPVMYAPFLTFPGPDGSALGEAQRLTPRAGMCVVFPSWLSHGIWTWARASGSPSTSASAAGSGASVSVNFFAVPLLVEDIDLGLRDAIHGKVSAYLQSERAKRDIDPSPEESVATSYYKPEVQVVSVAELHELEQFVIGAARTFFEKALRLPARRFEIERSWINVFKPGAQEAQHSHDGSLLSCSYYVEAPKNCGCIVMPDPIGARRSHREFTKTAGSDVLTRRDIAVEPQPGRLVMFESWLPHYVQCNKSDQVRISIAMNLREVPAQIAVPQCRRRRIAPRVRRLPKSLRTGCWRRVRPVAQRSAPTRSRSCSTSSSRSARISSSIWSP